MPRKRIGHRSYRVATLRQSLRRANIFSILWAGDRAPHREGSGPCGRAATGCTGKSQIRSLRCGTSRHRSPGLPAEHPPEGSWQRPCANVIRGLARREEHVDRTALRVSQDVQLRVQPALGPPAQPSAPPFLTARLDAVRCVFRWIESIITISVSCAWAASSVMMVANTPIRPQRFQRL